MWSHLEIPRELRHICDVIFLTEILTAATRSFSAFATIYLIYNKDYRVTMRGVQGLFLVTVTLWLVVAGEAKRKTKREDYVTMMSDEDSNYDEENENDEDFEPCQCGVFLSQQVGIKEGRRGRPRGPPQGEPVVTYDTDSPSLPCGTGGFKNCISRCLDVILKYLPRAGPVICGAVERDVHREKAFLFIRNCGGDWTPTSFSAGKEFCCTDGEHHKC